MEVRCPECGLVFKGEKKLLEHFDKRHSDENPEEIAVQISARYLGGHPSLPNQSDGVLYLYPSPKNKIVFESEEGNFEIDINKIKGTKTASSKEVDAIRVFLVGALALGWQKEKSMFLIKYEDELGEKQTIVFENSQSMGKFAEELFQLRVKLKNTGKGVQTETKKVDRSITKEVVKEVIIKIRCPFCKHAYDETLDKCPNCGATHV